MYMASIYMYIIYGAGAWLRRDCQAPVRTAESDLPAAP